jgi:hypothetical protein
MRTVRLARVAAQAEILLLRRLLAVAIRHAIFGVVAAVFAIAVLVMLHVMAVMALERFAILSPIVSVAIVLGVDLVVAALFGAMAAGKITDPVADEARRVRDTSIEQARQSLTLAALLAPATRVVAQTGLVRVLAQMLGAGLRRSRG